MIGLTVFWSQPSVSTLFLTSSKARLAEGIREVSFLNTAMRYVTEAIRAVLEESMKVFGSSITLNNPPSGR